MDSGVFFLLLNVFHKTEKRRTDEDKVRTTRRCVRKQRRWLSWLSLCRVLHKRTAQVGLKALFVSHTRCYLSSHTPLFPILKIVKTWRWSATKGERFVYDIIEQQLPLATKKGVRPEPFLFFHLLLSPPELPFVPLFSFCIICLTTVGSAEALHKDQRHIGQTWGTRPAGINTMVVAMMMMMLRMEIFQWGK